jgi:hypothetical protein
MLKRRRGSDGWPIITNNVGRLERGTIKQASVQDILQLVEEAARNRWSGAGRPAWLRKNAGEVTDIYVTLRGPEHDHVRCYVMVMSAKGPAGNFMLDMVRSKFESLKDLTQEELVKLVHRYFKSFPSVPLDPDQQATWDRRLGP